MKTFNPFKKEENQAEFSAEESSVEEVNEEVTAATKVKVIAALMIVGFATYIAYWVQTPVNTEFKADVLNQSQQSEQNSQSQLSEEAGFTQQVAISDFVFSPAQINIEKGTTVVWTNKDSVAHTITGQNFSSPTLNSGDSFSYKFNEDSKVNYHCTFHNEMQGTIVVGAGSPENSQVTSQTLAESQTQNTVQADFQTEQLHNAAVETSVVETPAVPENSQLAAEVPLLQQPTEQASQTVDSMAMAADESHSAAYTEDLNALQQQALAAQAAQEAAAVQKADQVKYKGKIAQSGPEDLLYLVAFGGILYLNRKKFLSAFA